MIHVAIPALFAAAMLALLWRTVQGDALAAVLLLAVTAGALYYLVQRAEVTGVLYPALWAVQGWMERRGRR